MRTRFTGYNLTIFFLFFGLAMVDAFRDRNYGVAGFWVFVGLIFVYGDFASMRKKHHG